MGGGRSPFGRVAARRWLPAILGVVVGVLLVVSSAGTVSPSRPGRASARAAPVLYADPEFLPLTLSSPRPVVHGEFGDGVAMVGSTMVVGAPYEVAPVGGVDSPRSYGCAYLFHGTNSSVISLCNTSPSPIPSYGTAVALGGGYVAIGNPRHNETVFGGLGGVTPTVNASGEVDIYRASDGAFVESVLDPNPYAGAEFGAAVAISGNWLVVGAPGSPATVTGAGGRLESLRDAGLAFAVNLLTNESRVLASPTPTTDGSFGAAVSLSGSTVVVGAPNESSEGVDEAGNAYVFNAGSGDYERTLWPAGTYANASFGASVAINGSYVAVGAPGTNNSTGLAYEYDLTTGSLHVLATGLGSLPYVDYGASVAISASWVAVGAPGMIYQGTTGAGVAYVYSTAAGTQIYSNFTAPQVPPNGHFGESIALTGSALLVGGPEAGSGPLQVGHAYLFTQIPLSYRADSPTDTDGFGDAVSVNDDAVAIGAPDQEELLPNDTEADEAGAVYYAPVEGGPVVQYVSPYVEADGLYGFAVAVSPTLLAVGAPGELGGFGRVYLYNLTPSANPLSILYGNGSLGYALSMNGDELAIGAPNADDGAGLVELLNLTTWNLTTIYGTSNDVGFGRSVAVSGDEVLAGTPFADVDAGEALLFNATSGRPLARLSAPDDAGLFGTSVALASHKAVIGAPDTGNASTGDGRAYVFSIGAPRSFNDPETPVSLVATLGAGLFRGVGQFGESVADNGAEIVVGAPREPGFGAAVGGDVYLFSAGSFALLDRYNAPYPAADAQFGSAVSLGPGGKLLVGDKNAALTGLMIAGDWPRTGATLFFL